MHWLNAVAMAAMISSGWGIYNDEAIFGWLFFPRSLTLGSWAAVHLQWHFAAMWLLVGAKTLAGAWRGNLFVSPCIATPN